MQIIGFNLTKILIDRKEEINKNLEIKQNIDINDIVEDKINITNKKTLKFKFKFQINYEPKTANIEFQGILLIIPNEDEYNKITESWKNKQIPNEFKVPLFNFIMNKCNVRALSLEDELNLPIHLQRNMPRINLKKED